MLKRAARSRRASLASRPAAKVKQICSAGKAVEVRPSVDRFKIILTAQETNATSRGSEHCLCGQALDHIAEIWVARLPYTALGAESKDDP